MTLVIRIRKGSIVIKLKYRQQFTLLIRSMLIRTMPFTFLIIFDNARGKKNPNSTNSHVEA